MRRGEDAVEIHLAPYLIFDEGLYSIQILMMEPFITNITRLLLPPTQSNPPEERGGGTFPIQNISNTLRSMPPTALADDISNALMRLAEGMSEEGMSEEDVIRHVRDELEKGFARGQSGPRYISFLQLYMRYLWWIDILDSLRAERYPLLKYATQV